MEIWKKIDGFETYSVSNMGRVRNDVTGRILSLFDKHNGYKMTTLYNAGKSHNFQVHRLVALAFIPNPGNLPQVNHINEDKTDNRVENLEWCTAKYNINYGTWKERMSATRRVTAPNKKRCIVDGVEYVSVYEAERQLKIPKRSLHKRLIEGRQRYKGHTIAYC